MMIGITAEVTAKRIIISDPKMLNGFGRTIETPLISTATIDPITCADSVFLTASVRAFSQRR